MGDTSQLFRARMGFTEPKVIRVQRIKINLSDWSFLLCLSNKVKVAMKTVLFYSKLMERPKVVGVRSGF